MRNISVIVLFSIVLVSGCNPPHDANPVADVVDDKPVEMEVVRAEAGVGKEGQKLKGKEGVLITPIKSLFTIKQQAAFDLGVSRALQFYEAAHGHRPKTQEEFMSKIIEFNQIQLPELPDGHEYVYDPETGELMVKRPKE